MGKPRPTPIERAIAGEPQDRRRRWDQRMLDAGFKQVKLWVPEERVPLLKELKSQLLDDADFEALRDFLAASYLAMLEDPECDDVDRQYARKHLAELDALPVPSEARADSAPSSDRGRK